MLQTGILTLSQMCRVIKHLGRIKLTVVDKIEADLLVIGGGGAGLMAAGIAASRNVDMNIVLIEQNRSEPCNTEIASNFIPAAGTRFQKASGVKDSVKNFVDDIAAKNNGKSDMGVTSAICSCAPEALHQLVDLFNVEIEYAPELTWIGHTSRRLHAHPTRSGVPIVAQLWNHLECQANIQILDNTHATGLILDNNRVVGATAVQKNRRVEITSSHVALTTGGFSANRKMLDKFIPEMSRAPNIGSKLDNGDGIQWGISAGAASSLMSGYQGRDCIFPDGTRVTPPVLSEGGIAINSDGRRFVNEQEDYSALARVYRAQSGSVAFFLWDDRIQKMVENVSVMQQAMKSGGIFTSDSIEVIANNFKLSPMRLEATVDQYNNGIKNGKDEFGRQLPILPLQSPWYSAQITGAIAHTQGGLTVDPHCRVIRPDGLPIPGLYAGGNTMAGLSGNKPEGYLSGNGLLVAYSSGFIIGNRVAELCHIKC